MWILAEIFISLVGWALTAVEIILAVLENLKDIIKKACTVWGAIDIVWAM